VVKLCRESWQHGRREGDGSGVEGEASVDDVGECKPADLSAGAGVEGDESDSESGGWVGRVESGADGVGVEGHGHVGVGRGGGHPACRVDEDLLSGFENTEDRSEASDT